MSPPSGLIGGFGDARHLDTETTALLSGVKGEVEKVRRGVGRKGMRYNVHVMLVIFSKRIVGRQG